MAKRNKWKDMTPEEEDRRLKELMRENNPDDEPVGHFTGRCGHCGSKDLWDDASAYGCNCCGAMWVY